MLAILFSLDSNESARPTDAQTQQQQQTSLARAHAVAPVTPPFVPAPRLMHARGVADSIAARIADRLEARQVSFAIEPEGGDLLGRGPAASKILLDLVEAALESMPEGGRLYVAVRALPSGAIELRVRDTGSGLPVAIVRRFRETRQPVLMAGFVPFGLVAARETAEGQRGRLEIVSRAGHGTGITVKLPPPQPLAAAAATAA